jgi:hypothetical protein
MAINLSTILGGLQSGTSVSASGTAVDFTGIPANVKQITVLFNGVSTAVSSANSSFLVQLGSTSGIVTTGYLSLSGNQNNSGTGEQAATTGIVVRNTSNSNINIGTMSIYNVSGNIWVASYVGVYYNQGTTESGGNVTLAGTLDRLRITTVGGTDTFDAGTFNIIYQ